MSTAGLGSDEIDRFVEVRLTRQEVLRRTQSPLKLTAIVNESVLRRRVGDGRVMRGQLQHIAELAEGPPSCALPGESHSVQHLQIHQQQVPAASREFDHIRVEPVQREQPQRHCS